MRLDHRSTVEARCDVPCLVHHHTGTTAARNGFVVLVLGIAKGEVVHGGLTARHHTQSAKQGIGDAARCFYIARHHGGWEIGVEHAAFGNDHVQGFQTTRIQRNVVVDQTSEHIQHRRHAHRCGRIEVVGLLRTGPCEINFCAAVFGIHANGHLNLRAIVEGQGEDAIFQARDHAAHRFFSVVLHMAHVGLNHIQAKLSHHFVQLLYTLFVGGQLSAQIGHVLLRIATGVLAAGQQVQHALLLQNAFRHQLEVVDLHAFFLNGGGERWHRARCGAAYVSMVTARAYIKLWLRCTF